MGSLEQTSASIARNTGESNPSYTLTKTSPIAIYPQLLHSKLLQFADDTKLCTAVGDDQETDILREDLRRMFRWSQDWQMLFNLEKCSVMHMGKRYQELSYEMGGKVLKVSEEDRDLGAVAVLHRG